MSNGWAITPIMKKIENAGADAEVPKRIKYKQFSR